MKLKHIDLYKNILCEYQNLSTCARLHVAALLVKDGRVLSVGYNGVPEGSTHCCDKFQMLINGSIREFLINSVSNGVGYTATVTEDEWKAEHHKWSEKNEIHAEMNCIAFALKNKIDISDCEMILSVSPCMNCAKLILSSGIKRVHYVTKYDRSTEGIDFLKANGVAVQCLHKEMGMRVYEFV